MKRPTDRRKVDIHMDKDKRRSVRKKKYKKKISKQNVIDKRGRLDQDIVYNLSEWKGVQQTNRIRDKYIEKYK